MTTAKGISLALEAAVGRLRKAPVTSLKAITERTNNSLRRRAG